MRSSLIKLVVLLLIMSNGTVIANESTKQLVSKPQPKEQTGQLIKDGKARLADNQQHQIAVNDHADKSQDLIKHYHDELKLLKNLTMYNNMLDRQLSDQNEEIDKLNHSIANATLVERQILPLLDRMVLALENFVAVDIPFLAIERQQRVENLKQLLVNPKLSTSEKARRVFEAYQIESEFGYTIESYQGNVSLNGSQFAVEFLRIGRIGLTYRDLSGTQYGFWNPNTRNWQALEESQYKRHITKGLKIAKEEIAPELITMPLVVNREAR